MSTVLTSASNQALPFRFPIRVYYEDTDTGGVVYHANYLNFFERARTEWLRHMGINQREMTQKDQVIFALKSTTVDYHLPAVLDDELVVLTHIEKIGRATVYFAQEIWRGEQCLTSGSFKVGCLNVNSGRPCAAPPWIYDRLLKSTLI